MLSSMGSMNSLSVIVPVYNEEKNVATLHAELVQTLQSLGRPYELLFINDGSTDGTLAELKKIRGITIFNLNRNYGQATALDAGFKAAQNDLIVSLDGDGQNDPRDIPRLISLLETNDLDVVAGWRRTRQDAGSVRILTKIGRFLRHTLITDPVHDSGCTLRVYTREAAKSLDIGGEMHRYIMALLRWKGFRIGELEVNHRARTQGVSKYTSSKAIRGFIDLIYIWFIYYVIHIFSFFLLFRLIFPP